MKNREDNIFYNLIRNETSLTEVFCNLMTYKVFRDMFLNFVKTKNNNFDLDIDRIKYKDFGTEKDLSFEENKKVEKKGRADLILNYNELDYIFELKIRVNTGLTEHQPDSYLGYLEKQDNEKNYNERLFFILPKGYSHIRDLETNSKVKNKNILYWEDILDKIKELELNKVNLFIDEFSKIMDYRWFYYADIKFSKEEINLIFNINKDTEGLKMLENRNVPQLMKKLFSIIDDLTNKFNYVKKEDTQIADYYGYLINNKNDKVDIWFGMDFDIWQETGYPLIIQIDTEDESILKEIKKFNGIKPFKVNDDTTFYYVPLEKKIFENSDDENITKKFKEKIDYVMEQVKNIK